ncbi:hypothetical protein G4923_06520 [Aeromonas rivipollensis]|uniref:Uncharacterized protein n=1 Tax=Aeromonas rivipollensis TaxID=948519 RepID=A0ABX0CWQ9_9GAMM|nr:hypothetical protein [Aeromonas rivipollensis]NEX88366.1 hypothetical protein [Aeromonas rivipollensis]NEY06085.1 hypothetical protein [Aeromonas rivipollensis]
MREIQVTFTTSVPDEVSDELVQEWLEFELHARGGMSGDNPLCGESLDADSFSVEFQ